MNKGGRFWIQAASLILIGLLWLARGFINNDFASIIIGLSLTLSAISFTLTVYVVSDSKIKHYTETVLLALSLGIIVYGYLASGASILMVFTLLVMAPLILGFILSYLLPKIRGEPRGKNNLMV